MSNQIVVTYSELFDHKPTEEDLSKIIREFKRTNTFNFLTMISNLLSLFSSIFDGEKFVYLQKFLSANLLDEETWKLTNDKLLGATPLERPIFHSWQMLFLMRKLLLEADDAGIHDPNLQVNKASRFLLGKACLIANDLIVTRDQEEKMSNLSPYKKAESNKVLDELLTQFLPTSELENPPEISRALVRTVDYLEISAKHFPDLIDGASLTAVFEKYSGISLDKFLQMILGVYGALTTKEVQELIDNPANFNISRSEYFSNLKYAEREVAAFYNLTTIGLEELRSRLKNSELTETLHDRYDFTLFRRFPLLLLSNDTITLIDISLLVEKVSIGLYHTILNCLLDNGVHPRPFFQHWGRVFEEYTNRIFYSIYPKITNRFHPNTYFEAKTEMEAFDGIVVYPEALITMEYKSGLLNTAAKYGADSKTLIGELNKKFGNYEKNSGARQLATKIELLFHHDSAKRKSIKEIDVSRARSIYPVLIVNDTALQLGLANWKIKQFFEDAISIRKIDSNVSIKSLMVLTIADLETLAPYLENEDFSFLHFVDFYSRLEYVQFSHFLIREHWFAPMTTIHQALYKFRQEKNIEPRKNEKMSAKWDSFVEKIIQSFKTSKL